MWLNVTAHLSLPILLTLMNVAEYHNQATLIASEFTYNTLIIINIPAQFMTLCGVLLSTVLHSDHVVYHWL